MVELPPLACLRDGETSHQPVMTVINHYCNHSWHVADTHQTWLPVFGMANSYYYTHIFDGSYNHQPHLIAGSRTTLPSGTVDGAANF